MRWAVLEAHTTATLSKPRTNYGRGASSHVCKLTCACMGAEARDQPPVLFITDCLSCVLKQGLSWVLDWNISQQAPRSTCLHMPSTRITGMHHHAWMFRWVLGIKLRSLDLHSRHFPNWAKAKNNPYPKSVKTHQCVPDRTSYPNISPLMCQEFIFDSKMPSWL